jgi:hypothetical protein
MKPGETRNPNGRPKKGESITEIAKKFLEDIPEGQNKTYKQLFFEKVYKKAVVEGDIAALKLVWNYVDGMPEQPIKHTGDADNPVTVKVYLPPKSYDADPVGSTD